MSLIGFFFHLFWQFYCILFCLCGPHIAAFRNGKQLCESLAKLVMVISIDKGSSDGTMDLAEGKTLRYLAFGRTGRGVHCQQPQIAFSLLVSLEWTFPQVFNICTHKQLPFSIRTQHASQLVSRPRLNSSTIKPFSTEQYSWRGKLPSAAFSSVTVTTKVTNESSR